MSEPGTDTPTTPAVPPPRPPDQGVRVPRPADQGDVDPGLVNPEDLGSASRSCLAIIVVLVVILLLLCVFLIGRLVA